MTLSGPETSKGAGKNAVSRISGGHLFPVFLIFLAGFLPYSNTLDSAFVFDDEPNIVLNPVIRELSNFLPNEAGWRLYPTRLMGFLSFAMNYRIDGLHVTGFHLVNIGIHIGNALLVYAFAYLIQQTPLFRGGKEMSFPKSLPLLSAILFAVHPVQTQAITYVVQRFASLATLFYLGSIVAFAKGRLAIKGIENGKRERPVPWYIVSWCCALLAVKTKEIAFTIPVVVALFDVSFFEGGWRKRSAILLPYVLIAMVIPLSLIRIDQPLERILSDTYAHTYLETDLSRSAYLFTQFGVIATYLRLLFFPVDLNLDYDYPIYRSLNNPHVLLPMLLILLLLGTALCLFAKSGRERNGRMRLLAFGIFWFFAALSVESSVIPILDVIFEHRVYLPSVGVFLAVVSLASLLLEHLHLKSKNVFVAVLSGIVILVLAGGTYSRNLIWRDNLSLWQDTVRKSPGKARPQYNFGLASEKSGNMDEAIEHYQAALNIDPKYHEAYNNLGVLFAKSGLIDDAIKHFEMAVSLKPNDADYHNNLSKGYSIKGWVGKAIEQRMLANRSLSTSR